MIVSESISRPRSALAATLARFSRREDGTVTIFGLMMFVLMVGVGGIAIDIMRYETQRVQLQYTLDRAVLAAAALNQTLDPEEVVLDYFATSGLPDRYRISVQVEEGINYRRVTADAEMDINSVFMHMFGVRAMTSPAYGAAEERIQNVEISLVLDISGSMGNNDKLVNMQDAATEFVNSVMESNDYENDDHLVSVSIIPYNGRVNAGSLIDSVFTLSDEHEESRCTRFQSSDFSQTAISPTQEIERLAHFDYSNRNRYSTFRRPHCQTDEYGAILPWSHSISDLEAHIASLDSGGWTAIDLGMNWAVGLLDPAAQPALSGLVTSGDVHSDFQGRPAAYDDDETLKIVVLMTDGENTRQYDLRQEFKDGLSTIYYHEDHDRWSQYVPQIDLYWVPYDNGDPSNPNYDDSSGYWSSSPYRGSESTQMPWSYFWSRWSARMLAGEFYYYPAVHSGSTEHYYDIRYGVELYADADDADANLRNICDAARTAGIIVFTIAFEAPARGREVMRYCATTEAHYYDVNGVEISEAFASIANTISHLKLIQ